MSIWDMEPAVLRELAIQALTEKQYLSITYNNQTRLVLPVSFRKGRNRRPKMYAWCSLHPTLPSEAFLCSKVAGAFVSSTPISYHPPVENELVDMDNLTIF
jgi:hypothetical protein